MSYSSASSSVRSPEKDIVLSETWEYHIAQLTVDDGDDYDAEKGKMMRVGKDEQNEQNEQNERNEQGEQNEQDEPDEHGEHGEMEEESEQGK